MRYSNIAALMYHVPGTAKVKPLQTLPETDPLETHYIIDGIAHLYKKDTQGLTTFQDLADKYS